MASTSPHSTLGTLGKGTFPEADATPRPSIWLGKLSVGCISASTWPFAQEPLFRVKLAGPVQRYLTMWQGKPSELWLSAMQTQ